MIDPHTPLFIWTPIKIRSRILNQGLVPPVKGEFLHDRAILLNTNPEDQWIKLQSREAMDLWLTCVDKWTKGKYYTCEEHQWGIDVSMLDPIPKSALWYVGRREPERRGYLEPEEVRKL